MNAESKKLKSKKGNKTPAMQKKLRRGLNGSDDGAFFRGDALILAALSGFLLFLSFWPH